ncbi:thiamine ABC transporter substrate-binding protein [Nakamurella sp. YIM 132087]|uniref:Thiamine ABC transporter substrate-binding protein n=1 Tax=Nakamurella alba TaxID=2665158 RepID=A0A7K1FFL8_9ACTN|nr:thiamine ABC transporter substrate-binding protein [Nakamurella alba]MTD12915.1 thiamine ABC transporter substrate-binding protein [Nakamurella alba]
MRTALFAGRRPVLAAALAGILLLATGCGSGSEPAGSTGTSTDTAVSSSAAGSGSSGTPGTEVATGEVVLITHDSFNVDEQVLADFEKSSGLTVTLLAQGDAGAVTNKLVLTKDNPLGDAVFGIDNTFASRALEAGVLDPYTSPEAGNGSDEHGLGAGDPDHRLTAVDYGDVCVNVDHTWFTDKGLAEPTTYEQLADPAYKDLLVVESPATSSPGLAFLLGTVAHFGADGWQDYWTSLKANGVKVTSGWEDAYGVDFSGSSGKGARPLVVSYASSPPYEVPADAAAGTPAPTGALLDTCFRQVEYAGVLTGAKNPAGARKVIDFLLSQEFQTSLPEQMYVYPVDTAVDLPASWTEYAPPATDPATVDPAEIATNREDWVQTWSDLVEG